MSEPCERVPLIFREVLSRLVERLAGGDFSVDGIDVGVWIRDYPATLVPLPPEAWHAAEAGPISGGGWWIILPLWTAEEGRSDLTLTATGYESPTRVTGVDVHAL